MLLFNVKRIANLRGITNVFTYLRKLGISHNVATRFASGGAFSVSFRHLELLCKALNCTPNDLIEFVPEEGSGIDANHPLSGLAKTNVSENFKQLLQNLPVEKFKELTEIISAENKKEAQS